ncbi:MAG TPA: hypothetical protein VFQ70_04055, partial [Candidatus Saccharimonadaceae bacterium]|nr:hypothetical protein [Candidatus Saccharimonadaceae bacterium]
ATRRSTVDSARMTFRNGVLSVIEGRRSVIMGQAQTFQSNVSAAFQAAVSACTTNSGNTATIRTTLVDSLKTDRETYTSDRKDDAKVGTQISSLATTRDQAITTADATMKAAVQAAASQLKVAFGESSSATSGSV